MNGMTKVMAACTGIDNYVKAAVWLRTILQHYPDFRDTS